MIKKAILLTLLFGFERVVADMIVSFEVGVNGSKTGALDRRIYYIM
jgi:hypothetical protein